ncbi:MAG: nuclear transport factor 2 family protein, partial [Rhodococcus sp. (in: high G+C Gram-positive bacteria)]|nr:nuclear transport factor 2 family protein [Rhodococcus sp. (in: high G+C Gram-positive bacteria)]
MDRALQDLIDKQAIREVVLTYCRGIDRLDFDLVRSAYHPDAIDHHTGFDGNIDEYIAWVTPKLSAIGCTMHHIGNHLVERHGDQA